MSVPFVAARNATDFIMLLAPSSSCHRLMKPMCVVQPVTCTTTVIHLAFQLQQTSGGYGTVKMKVDTSMHLTLRESLGILCSFRDMLSISFPYFHLVIRCCDVTSADTNLFRLQFSPPNLGHENVTRQAPSSPTLDSPPYSCPRWGEPPLSAC